MEDLDIVKKYFGMEWISDDPDHLSLLKSAIKNFQNKNDLDITGEMDMNTLEKIKNIVGINESNISTDSSENTKAINPDNGDLANLVSIEKHIMPSNEYCRDKTKKKRIILHFTAGWNNPFNQIDQWARDSRGKVGAGYCIGGINIANNDPTYDGRIAQSFEDDYWAYHIGPDGRKKLTAESESIAIEVCNFGYLKKEGTKFYTYTGREVDKKYVTELDKEFRGYKYYHKLTDRQIVSIINLIKYLGKIHNIDYKKGITQDLNFEWRSECYNVTDSGGLFVHSNYRKSGKWDWPPTKEMIKIIQELKK